MADAVVKPIKMAIIKNPTKGYIRTPSSEEIKKYEEREERLKRGLAGREWILSKESGFTSKVMGQRFISNIDKLLEEWEPQPRFSITKIDDNTLLDNRNLHPISLTPEFIKEIQSI